MVVMVSEIRMVTESEIIVTKLLIAETILILDWMKTHLAIGV